MTYMKTVCCWIKANIGIANLGNIETVSFEDGNLVLKGGDTTLKFEQVDPE